MGQVSYNTQILVANRSTEIILKFKNNDRLISSYRGTPTVLCPLNS